MKLRDEVETYLHGQSVYAELGLIEGAKLVEEGITDNDIIAVKRRCVNAIMTQLYLGVHEKLTVIRADLVRNGLQSNAINDLGELLRYLHMEMYGEKGNH